MLLQPTLGTIQWLRGPSPAHSFGPSNVRCAALSAPGGKAHAPDPDQEIHHAGSPDQPGGRQAVQVTETASYGTGAQSRGIPREMGPATRLSDDRSELRQTAIRPGENSRPKG